ncbi:hypothetical protein AWB79_07529 [Caballeronia hypogeia]|uniref:Ribbon-helix-helix protein CopG domain-containing protein n=1 Tax=Caballeronia hypogeia TaxID=1777140 RepID=A0A158DT91_9BURK|nr:hypothetical protein [Caballeronia hypogeia]SAK97869.1 hypothetical protein AWB79_07529 [Caballeronia hypogeia]
MRKGVIPDKPYADADDRTVSAKVSPEFQKRLREFAVQLDTSVSTLIKTALSNYMEGAH